MDSPKKPSDNLIRVKYSLELLHCLIEGNSTEKALDDIFQSQLFETDVCEKIKNKVDEIIILPLDSRAGDIRFLHYNLFGC